MKHDRWWFRREIPEAIRGALGKGRYWMVNLETGDLRSAQRLRDVLERETKETFDLLRSGESVSVAGLTAREQGILHRESLAVLAEHQQEGPDMAPGLADIARWSAEDTAESFRHPAEREAFLDALQGQEPVEEHLEAHLERANLVAKTLNERRGLIRRFAKWAAAQEPVSLTLARIDRRQAGRYVSEVIDPMHPRTQKKHLTALRGYWRYLAARGLIDLPAGEARGSGWPWNDQEVKSHSRRVERGRKEEEERPFTTEEVRSLLFDPDPEGITASHIPTIREALTVSLLSGMRLSEVLSVWVEDVKEGPEGAGLVFDLQQGKTEASAARMVPVHSGLVDLVKRRMAGKGGKEWLFHEFSKMRDPGDTFGKRFARYRKKLGVDDVQPGKRRSLVNFHSARRWFITTARHAGQDRETVADVVGHVPDTKDMTFGVYTHGASPEQMRACVEAVMLPRKEGQT